MPTTVTLRPAALEFDLFAGLGREVVAGLTRGLTAIPVAPGEEVDIAEHGASGAIVWAGRLTLEFPTDAGHHRTVTLAEEGDLLISPPSSSAQVGPQLRCKALSPSVVALLMPGDLERWLGDPVVAGNVVRVLSAQIADRELAVAIALEGRVERRLLLKLRQLALRWGRVTPKGVRLDLRLTHQDLADMVGAVRESVTLAFGRLTRQGEIEVTDRTILIPMDGLTDRGPRSATGDGPDQ